MASPLIDFCEPANPAVLKEVQKASFQNANRIQRSFLARAEKRTLVWLAERTPAFMNSDHLTILGFTAQLLAGASYALARYDHLWLLAGIGFLALNWLGDSLDGTLARVRQRQRPRYGFYVDHILDSFGSLALMGGLALSGFVSPWIAAGMLVGFLLLSIQSYLATYTLGEFRMSFWSFGPTEIRILLALGNLALLHGPRVLHGKYLLFDIGGAIAIGGMALMLVFFTARNIHRLYHEEKLA
jgi:phosphatidylglycerophosphate synthase